MMLDDVEGDARRMKCCVQCQPDRCGHEDSITAIDSLMRERAVTVGQDRLVHIFKIPEETAVRFAKHMSVQCFALAKLNY